MLESLADAIRSGRPFEFDGVRVMPTPSQRGPSESVQLTNPLITALVTGQAELVSDWMSFVAPMQTTTKLKNDYPIFAGDEQFIRRQVERPATAEYGHSEFTPTEASFTLTRKSWSSMVDEQTLRNADSGLRIAEKYSGFARRIVRKFLEYVLRDKMDDTTTASYAAGHTATIAGGSEWTVTTVDPRDSVDAGIDVITAALGVEQDQIAIFLPHVSRRALYGNPAFRTWNIGQQAKVSADPSFDVVADFFGVGSAMTANPLGKDPDTESTAALFGDNFYLFVPDLSPEYDTEFGAPRWISEIAINAGVAADPFWLGKQSSWLYPWDQEQLFVTFKNTAAYRGANTVA